MSEKRPRDEDGKFAGKVTEQEILKTFDRVGEPMTAPELADELPITKEGVTNRLKQMQEKDLVGRKKAGARAVVWWAKVAPKLDPSVEESADEAEPAMTQDEVKEKFGIES
jgi:DNA-binding MarR family transcriptional regulator